MAPPIFELKGSPSRVRTSALYVSSSGVDALYGVQASWWGQRTKRLLLSSAKISAQDLEETKDGAETGSNEENSGQEADEDEAEPALVEAEDGGAKILPYDFTKVAVAFSKDGTKSKQKYLFFQSAAGDIYEYRISTKTSFKIVATDAPKAKLGTALAAAVSKQSTLLFYQADENDSIVCLSRKDDEAGTWTYTSVSADSAPGTDLSAVQWLNQKNNYVGVAFTSKHAVDQTALGSRAADTGSESAGATDPEAAADTGSEAAADTGSEAAADTGSESAADTGSESAAAIGSESATESSLGACRIDICFANLGEDGAQPLKFELSPVQISAPKLRGAFAVSRVRYPYDTGDIIDKFCVCGQLDEDESSLVSVWTDSEGKKDEEQTNVSKLTDDIGPHRSGKHLVTSIGVAHIPGSRWVQVAYATESGVMFSRLIEYALPRAGIVFEADDLKALIDILNPPDTNVIGKRLLESLQKMYDQLRTTAPREITWHDDKKYKEVDEQVSPVDP